MTEKLIKLTYEDKNITLIPTAHVSRESAELVASTIDELQPDCICVELDEDRYRSITEPDRYRNTDITKIIKDKKVGFMFVNLLLGSYQKKMAKQLGSKTGQEMLTGINKAKELNVPLVNADRSIQTTFKRIWANMTFKDKVKLLSAFISSVGDNEEISEEELAKLQKEDMLTNALGEVSREFPFITDVLVTERDRYLTEKIRKAPGHNIVAVLGAAHTIGIQKYLNDDIDIEKLDNIPEPKMSSKIIKWIIPVILVVAIALSFRNGLSEGLNQLKRWVLFNGTLSALGTLAAGGHILSILTAFVAAPITSLNPLLAAGWFAGLVEAWLRKPTVKDFDDLSEDLNSIKGVWKNKVTRILLVVILANIGSTLGTFIAGLDVFKNLFS